MTFPVRFLACNIFICILLGCMLILKKCLKKHITLNVQYRLWYVFIFAMLIPFLPYRSIAPANLLLKIRQLFSRSASASASALTGSTPPSVTSDWGIRDFSTAIASSGRLLNWVLFGIWILGMLLAAALFLRSTMGIYFLKKKAYPVNRLNEPDLYQQFAACSRELGIKRSIRLYASCDLPTPVSYGWLRPTVMIPQDLDILLSEKDLRFIFLHELQHYKQRDAFVNDLVCLLQIVYWFNPFIWYGFRQLRKDREIACDHLVLSVIGSGQAREYGYTILQYAKHMQKGMHFSFVSALGGGKELIRQRIVEIAGYQKDSALQKTKSIGVLLLILALVYCLSPLLTAYASSDSSFRLKDNRWTELDLSSYFQGTDGSFVLYDMEEEQYQIYNKELSTQRVSPDSTFKIYSGLFALEEQVISPKDSLKEWDGNEQPFDAWEQNQTLNTAMHDSVNWYFQNLDRQLGLSKLYSYYQKISYGNCDLSGGTPSYWAQSSLKISPVEQVNLLAGLLENKWDFKVQNIEAVKDALFLKETSFGRLYGKTGTGIEDGKLVNGWFVGFLEHEGRTYCFAANLKDSEYADGRNASAVTIQVLESIF